MDFSYYVASIENWNEVDVVEFFALMGWKNKSL